MTGEKQAGACDMRCSDCNIPAVREKSMRCRKIGNNIMLAMERYSITHKKFSEADGEFKYRKVNTRIEPDDISLDGNAYTLRALVNHIGPNAQSGHYIAFISERCAHNGVIMCDDGMVSRLDKVPDDAFYNSRLMIYTKVEPHASVSTAPVQGSGEEDNGVRADSGSDIRGAHYVNARTQPPAQPVVPPCEHQSLEHDTVVRNCVATQPSAHPAATGECKQDEKKRKFSRMPNLTDAAREWIAREHDRLVNCKQSIAPRIDAES